eukprot:jgi/Botrbrau1/16071/Bobra.7_2s0042.1
MIWQLDKTTHVQGMRTPRTGALEHIQRALRGPYNDTLLELGEVLRLSAGTAVQTGLQLASVIGDHFLHLFHAHGGQALWRKERDALSHVSKHQGGGRVGNLVSVRRLEKAGGHAQEIDCHALLGCS